MENPQVEKKGNKKIAEVQTVPVPLPLTENQGKLIINTDTPSKDSKEQIIKQALDLHSQGNIEEAAKIYQYLINQGFNDHRVFFKLWSHPSKPREIQRSKNIF